MFNFKIPRSIIIKCFYVCKSYFMKIAFIGRIYNYSCNFIITRILFVRFIPIFIPCFVPI